MLEVILAYWAYVKKIVVFSMIVIFFYLVAKLASNRILKARFIGDINYLKSLARITKLSLVIIGILIGLASIGVSLTGLLAAAGFTGIVVGLAAQQTLGHLIAGLTLLFEGRARIGDVVKINDFWGTIESISLLSTQVRLFTGELLTVPNQTLMSSLLTNASNLKARRIDVNIGISYLSSIDRAREVIIGYLRRHPYVLAYPEPRVFIDSLGESSVNLRIMLWVPASKLFDVRGSIIGELKNELEKNGIEIPFPQRVVWLKQAEKS
jgi:small-conductance mechanosensitive channel